MSDDLRRGSRRFCPVRRSFPCQFRADVKRALMPLVIGSGQSFVVPGALVVLFSLSSRGAVPFCRTASIGLFFLGSALSIGGCASGGPNHVRAPRYEMPVSAHAASVGGGPTDIDDPTEPFSPNYGRYLVVQRADAAGPPIYLPNDLPTDFRLRLAKSITGS